MVRTPRRCPWLAWVGIATLSVAAAACAQAAGPLRPTGLERQPDGVVLSLEGGGSLRLRVCTDDTVRVTQWPGAPRPDRPSLAVVARWRTPPWTLTDTPGEVVVATGKVRACVSRATGAIAFTDARGRLLLQEPAAEARSLTAARVAGEETWHAGQRFLLQRGEALYGLGQHANGSLNQRGLSVTLRQVNMDVGVPVLVSSRGYGLLWDNPSLTRVDCGASVGAPIPAARLYDRDGTPGGLTGEYFDGVDLRELRLTRRDAGVDFVWPQDPAPGLPADQFSVRWTGEVMTGAAGDYTFATTSDDGVRLWVDGKLLVDDWTVHAPRTASARVRLEAGRRYPVRMEFFEDKSGAAARLAWTTPDDVGTGYVAWQSEVADAVDYYFLYGPEPDAVVAAYRRATGPAPLLGRWAWGFWQCRERYQTQAELLGVLAEYRRRGVPIDNIIQDWFYWAPEPWGSHHFDPARYPDPTGMVRQVHDAHAHIAISVWAKFAPGSDNHAQLLDRGLLYPGGGERYYDAFSAGGRATYWRQMRDALFARGFDAWWLDASEPEDGGFFTYTGDAGVKTAAGPAARVLNAYPLMHTTGVYEGQRAATSAKRVFILTRSAWAGQQRNAATTWSGDITGDWATLKRQIPAGLNFCLSGIPFWNTDIGGFISGQPADPAYRELFVRWFQFGAFCPMFRVHGTGARKEMWEFGPEAEAILVAFDRLRYRLLPYIYSAAWRVTSEGYTLMRPLVMDFRADPKALDIGDQFTFGPALMVCPVTDPGATTRRVYLPAGAAWYDFWTGRRHDGGQEIAADAPLERMPIFVRAGSVLPLGPVVQWWDEAPADPIEVRVYPGADGAFTLYEDEGDGYDYERGAYATIPLAWADRARTLTVGQRRGSFPGMLGSRSFRLVAVGESHGVGIEPSAEADATVAYSGRAVTASGR